MVLTVANIDEVGAVFTKKSFNGPKVTVRTPKPLILQSETETQSLE